MPEFEEPDSKPNPDHNYAPSSDAQKKTGGRRRSGGFKSDAVPSNNTIGEVDPSEALELKTEQKQPASETTAEAPETKPTPEAIKPVKDEPKEPSRSRAPKQPQPSKAPLQSIKSVEEKIAGRRAEAEKTHSAKDADRGRKARKHSSKPTQKGASARLFAAIRGLFGKLFGKGSESTSKDTQRLPSRKKYSKNDNRHYRDGTPKNNKQGSNPKKPRGSRRRRRPNNTQHRSERSSH